MTPANFSRLVVDGFDDAFAPESVVRPSPAIGAVSGLGKIERVTFARRNDKQSVPGIETWRAEVGHAAFIGRDQASVWRRFFARIRNRAALLIDAQRPVHWAEGHGEKAFAVGAIEDEEVAVAR